MEPLGITAVIGAAITLVVAVIRVIDAWKRMRTQQDRIEANQRASAKRERERRQMDEFYGPLYSLLTECLENRQRFLDALRENDQVLADEILNTSILPTNERISVLIRNSYHLMEPGDDPQLYRKFLRHADTFRDRYSNGKMRASVRVSKFPPALMGQVRSVFDDLQQRYYESLPEPRREKNMGDH